MKLSVCMITYGHEQYIKDSMLGVLKQEAGFEIELIIAEDRSPDATEKVVKEIIANHPNGHWIKYTRHAVNKGMMDNFIWALEQCKGEYIAICEGDDYWIDPLKLEKQVALLEKHPTCSFSFHKGIRINEVAGCYDVYPEVHLTEFDPASFFGLTTIPVASVVFRNNFPIQFIRTHSHPDFQLLCQLMTKGTAVFLPEVMSVYRVHPGGISYHHGSFLYAKRRTDELYEEAHTNYLSDAVQQQVARLFISNVQFLFTHYRKELSFTACVHYLKRVLQIKKPGAPYRTNYWQLLQKMFA